MFFFKTFKKKGWSVNYAYDEAYDLDKTLNFELKYKKNICKLSRDNYFFYINNLQKETSKKLLKRKTALLINGEIRNADNFIKWIRKVEDYTYIYIYTDKSSFAKIDKDYRNYLEDISDGLSFSEEDAFYQENFKNKKNLIHFPHQWLKLRQSIYKWIKDWETKEISTILRFRTDISFLNPQILEYQIRNGFSDLVYEGVTLGRSDLLFAFNIKDSKIFSEFYDSIFSFYLSDDWIKYPYTPLHPNLIIRSKGSMRLEWNNFPEKYIGFNPTKNQFYERISHHYEKFLTDYENYSSSGEFNYKRRNIIFGNLSSVRNQDIKLITSERNLAHYLVRNGMKLSPHNHLFSGQIIREKYRKIKFLRSLIKKI